MRGIPEDSIFLMEWLAGNRYKNQLPISAVCNSHCIFCSNNMNPFSIKKGIFRDLDDIKLQLSLMPSHDDPIRMSDSLPGRISEGEAFLHPRFFQIIELVRKKFLFNPLCFTTNGSMLDEAFLKKLARFRPFEIDVSMHSTQPGLWARIFGKSEEDARRAIGSPKLIKQYHMDLLGTIVPLPKICGWHDLEYTYSTFVSHGAKRMIIYRPGYTVRTPAEVIKDLDCPQDEFMDFAERMRSRHGIPVAILPDMRGPLEIPVKKIRSHTLQGNPQNNWGPFKKVLWLTSSAAQTRIKEMVERHTGDFPNHNLVIPVENGTYGGNIIVSGLLMVDDFIRAGKQALERWPDIDLILVPKMPFDNLNRDLQKTPAFKISDALKKPVWLVNKEGDIDPLLSRVFVKKS